MQDDEIVPLNVTPQEILLNPLTNKGTGFTHEERQELGLEGLLPDHVSTIEEQVARRFVTFSKKRTMLGRYRFLNALQDRNEILFYRFVYEHVGEMLPLIYTPTVGEASINYSYIYNQNRGVYISYRARDRMAQVIDNIPRDDVDVIVVTDGERILGLGDLGVGGMVIPVGKLSLYTLFGGIHPARTLPILLDVGTNNPKLLDDPLYLGYRNERVRGKEYDAFIESFITNIKRRYPNVLLQWEDFAKPNAYPLLDRYRERICSFNDDIQGTASVALSAILAAVKATKGEIGEQRIAILGGGSAGLGIANLILSYMLSKGVDEAKARACFYIVDIQGLVHDELSAASDEQKAFAQSSNAVKEWDVENPDHITLADVVDNAHPTILIGVSTQGGAFNESIVKTMAKHVERPVIFPLSNPTSKAEAAPDDLVRWTEGRAIIACGSPFPPVHYEGSTYHIGQCNNVYIFPGVGLGVIAAGAKKVTDEMFIKAAEVVSTFSPLLDDPKASLFPSFEGLRKVSEKVAVDVAKIAIRENLATVEDEKGIEERVKKQMWFPKYPRYTKN